MFIRLFFLSACISIFSLSVKAQFRDFKTNNIDLPDPKPQDKTKWGYQNSTYEMVGFAGDALVVQEIIRTDKKNWRSAHDNEVILHFLDPNNNYKSIGSKSVWKAENGHRPDKISKSPEHPNTIIFKDRVYLAPKTLWKGDSEIKKQVAAKVVIAYLKGTQLVTEEKLVHSPGKNYTPFILQIADDSSYIYMTSADLLAVSDKKTDKNLTYGVKLFNKELTEVAYHPIAVYGAYHNLVLNVLKDCILYFGPGETDKSTVLNALNIETGEVQSMEVESDQYTVPGSPGFHQVLRDSDDQTILVVGWTCYGCDIKQVEFMEFEIDRSGSPEPISMSEIEASTIEDTGDGDQDDEQISYFQQLQKTELKDLNLYGEKAKNYQNNGQVATGSAIYYRHEGNRKIIGGKPIFVATRLNDETSLCFLNRSIHLNEFFWGDYVPHVVHITDEEILFIDNFFFTDNSSQFKSGGPSVLQILEVDRVDQTVTRSNLMGDIHSSESEAHKFLIQPGKVAVKGNTALCVMITGKSNYSLAEVKW